MKKADLILAVVEKTGLAKKDSAKAVDAMLESISESLAKGNKVQLFGFGTFQVRNRNAREGHNPATGETIKIEASKVPTFKAGKGLKDKVR